MEGRALKNIAVKQKGILLMLLSALSFSVMQGLVSFTSSSIGIWQQIVFRTVVNCVIAYFLIRRKGVSLFGAREHQPTLFARSLLGSAGLALIFFAAAHGHQADLTIINRINPFIVAILSVIFLKERPSRMLMPSMLIAFAGAYIAARPAFETDFLPLLCAFAGAFTSGVAYTLLSYFKGRADGLTVVFHCAFVSLVVAVPGAAVQWVTPTPFECVLLVLIGLFASLGQFCVTFAYQYAPAVEVSVYNYSGIIFSILVGYFMLGEPVYSYSVIGGGMVIASSVVLYFYDRRTERKQPSPPPEAAPAQLPRR